MTNKDLWARIYDEISDALDLLDNTTALEGSEDSLGQAELALDRAREVLIADGAPRIIAEAPAMLAALRNLLPMWSSGIDEPWVMDARAILSRIDGAATAQPAGDDPAITAAANLSRAGLVEAAGEALALQAPISEAGDHCASCGAEEGESHGAQCETRGFAVGVDARRLDTGALRTVAGDDAAWLEATASRDGRGGLTMARKLPESIADALEDWQVDEPGMWENETGPAGWWAVSNSEESIVAYFAKPEDAYRWRLSMVNRDLNP